jgi:hypothetical protein
MPLVIAFLVNILAGTAALLLAVGLLVAWSVHFSNIGLCYKKANNGLNTNPVGRFVRFWICWICAGLYLALMGF